jgi:hypothetical protein
MRQRLSAWSNALPASAVHDLGHQIEPQSAEVLTAYRFLVETHLETRRVVARAADRTANAPAATLADVDVWATPCTNDFAGPEGQVDISVPASFDEAACAGCDGQGHSVCPECQGTGHVSACPYCHGRGTIRCVACKGTGTVRGQQCTVCYGHKSTDCFVCHYAVIPVEVAGAMAAAGVILKDGKPILPQDVMHVEEEDGRFHARLHFELDSSYELDLSKLKQDVVVVAARPGNRPITCQRCFARRRVRCTDCGGSGRVRGTLAVRVRRQVVKDTEDFLPEGLPASVISAPKARAVLLQAKSTRLSAADLTGLAGPVHDKALTCLREAERRADASTRIISQGIDVSGYEVRRLHYRYGGRPYSAWFLGDGPPLMNESPLGDRKTLDDLIKQAADHLPRVKKNASIVGNTIGGILFCVLWIAMGIDKAFFIFLPVALLLGLPASIICVRLRQKSLFQQYRQSILAMGAAVGLSEKETSLLARAHKPLAERWQA